jgi:hypothetical protein
MSRAPPIRKPPIDMTLRKSFFRKRQNRLLHLRQRKECKKTTKPKQSMIRNCAVRISSEPHAGHSRRLIRPQEMPLMDAKVLARCPSHERQRTKRVVSFIKICELLRQCDALVGSTFRLADRLSGQQHDGRKPAFGKLARCGRSIQDGLTPQFENHE